MDEGSIGRFELSSVGSVFMTSSDAGIFPGATCPRKRSGMGFRIQGMSAVASVTACELVPIGIICHAVATVLDPVLNRALGAIQNSAMSGDR